MQIANRCYLNQVGDETCSQVAATFSAEVKIGFAPPENVRGVKMLPAAEKSSSLRIADILFSKEGTCRHLRRHCASEWNPVVQVGTD